MNFTHCIYLRSYFDINTKQYERIFIVRPPFSSSLGTPAAVLNHTKIRALPPISDYKGHMFIASRDGCAQLIWSPKTIQPYYANVDTPYVLQLLIQNGFKSNETLTERLKTLSNTDGEEIFLVGDFST